MLFQVKTNIMQPDKLSAESVEVAWAGQLTLGGKHTFCRGKKTNCK